MKVVSIIGRSGTGKTATAEALIRELRSRGYSVVAAKDTHQDGFSVDTPGKDSWRLAEAGGFGVVLRAPGETSLIFRRRLSPPEIAAHMEADFLVLEGFRDAQCANIACAHDAEGLAEEINERTIAASGRVSATLTTFQGLPVISALDDPAGLADIVETGARSLPMG